MLGQAASAEGVAITGCTRLTYDDAVRFVMVPGGWQGGWAFDSVAAELRREGHDVEALTLSGLEPDSPADVIRAPNLDTHIDQVAETIERGDGTPVALCGHSYGGMVIAGVADRLGDRLDQLVFIDAYVPDDGDSCWSLTSDRFRELFMAGARADGRWVAVPEGLDPRARPHPLASFVQSIRLGGNPSRALGRTFISGGAWPGSPFVPLTERLRSDSDWRVHEIPVGHNIARRDPHTLAAVLGALPLHSA
ncbi:alpha/beta hydrolase family protein [Streptomyces sp. BK208]|uniref:alpha/beta hydrolase n=1 Tax=Streptomyces sp. BK208 TaxID=2512150 RepID=UPI0010D87724|nr:alpha/beta fold hydrolase [Streptomyces sp. BK208]TDT42072.1 alpha/beta hydrolase family protein [Streptomyces sp. BK208]